MKIKTILLFAFAVLLPAFGSELWKDSDLFDALKGGNYEEAVRLIDAGAGLNWRNKDGDRPLLWAAREGHSRIVEALIEAGADVNLANKQGDTALDMAKESGYKAVVAMLKEAGGKGKKATSGEVPYFIEMAKAGDIAEINRLLAAEADVNFPISDSGVIGDRYYTEGETALHLAAINGHLDIVNSLITAEADVNAMDIEKFPPLYYAAREGHLEIVNVLIAAGADINAMNKWGSTPLRGAVGKKQLIIVNALIAAGADINMARGGSAPLMRAIERGYSKIVAAFIEAGVDVNMFFYDTFSKSETKGPREYRYTFRKLTPLVWAVINGKSEIVKMLVDAGADVNAVVIGDYTHKKIKCGRDYCPSSKETKWSFTSLDWVQIEIKGQQTQNYDAAVDWVQIGIKRRQTLGGAFDVINHPADMDAEKKAEYEKIIAILKAAGAKK